MCRLAPGVAAFALLLLSVVPAASAAEPPASRRDGPRGLAAHVAQLEAQVKTLTAALNAEVAARMARDAQLQRSLDSETAARVAGDAFAKALEEFVTIDRDPINGLAGPHVIFECKRPRAERVGKH
jgi:hypothetical protein